MKSSEFQPTAGSTGYLLLGLTVAGLITYKTGSALTTFSQVERTGTLAAKTGMVPMEGVTGWLAPFAASINYLGWVLVALLFGIVLGALVKTYLPEQWLIRSLGASGARGVATASAAGAPLMLCSCCVAPVFEGVYERTRRLAPSLGLMFAAPSLNPAALLLTFLLFPLHIALGRTALALALVLLGSLTLGYLLDRPGSGPSRCPLPLPSADGTKASGFTSALWETSKKTLPAIALGILASAVLIEVVPFAAVAQLGGGFLPIILISAVAVLVALPTFGEIPIALALHAAGFSDGMVLAVLVGGPAVNAPSLITLARRVSPRAAVLAGLTVFWLTVAGGLAITFR